MARNKVKVTAKILLSLSARKRSTDINNSERSQRPESEQLQEEKSRNQHCVLGTDSFFIEVFYDGNVKHIFSCAPEDFPTKHHWSITRVFITALRMPDRFYEVGTKGPLLRKVCLEKKKVFFFF